MEQANEDNERERHDFSSIPSSIHNGVFNDRFCTNSIFKTCKAISS
ncbi:MAG: hypothetical protein ACFFCS_21925 [Candidatus Hodarchaeota archaeon]